MVIPITKDRFTVLGEEVKTLTIEIDNAQKAQDKRLSNSLKKEMYLKKVEQLELLQSDIAISSTVTAKELSDDVASRPNIPKYMTGTPLDDRLGGGIEIGTFIQLAGESFTGKTHFVLEILANISGANKILFFNFEMGERRINNRLKHLLISTEQDNNFLINSKARKLSEIIQEIKNKAKEGIKFFAIDSKMKIEVPEETEDLKAFRKISHELSKLSQQEEIIILLINQMNEQDQQNGRLAFKGGGDQMYDADIALFYMLNKTKSAEPKDWTRTMHCRKNRTGDEQLFRVDLVLDIHGKTKELIKP
ncbi:MAG: hypothetical protein E3J96_02670 [Sulfurovum sp.]|nr:MAG: hypothetical protein E3J96_02670 [Sulfurovum sp.]